MAVKTITRPELPETDNAAVQNAPIEGIILEVDYIEDRPVSLLAKRQREFQKSLQGQYVDTEMPAS